MLVFALLNNIREEIEMAKKYIQNCVRIDQDLKKRFDHWLIDNDMSFNAYVIAIMEKELANADAKNKESSRETPNI